jgi:hypothetical protein
MIARSTYVIEVRGRLPSSLASQLVGFDIVELERSTVLTGDIADGAALYGVLARLESLGVPLVSVQPVTGRTAPSASSPPATRS